jgi:hypothetical protein
MVCRWPAEETYVPRLAQPGLERQLVDKWRGVGGEEPGVLARFKTKDAAFRPSFFPSTLYQSTLLFPHFCTLPFLHSPSCSSFSFSSFFFFFFL